MRLRRGRLVPFAVLALLPHVGAAQQPSTPDLSHLETPRIVTLDTQRVIEVQTTGDPNDVGVQAFGLLYQLYFSSGAASGASGMPIAKARWPENLDQIAPEDWEGRYALAIPDYVESLPAHNAPEGTSASIATWEYGDTAEILHIGAYDQEQPTIERLLAHIEAEGYEPVGGHEEEYVLGPSMAGPGNPAEYQTILRYRVRKAPD